MNNFVTTLPITPSTESPYLRFYTPLLADIFSRLTGTPFKMFCNTVGFKTGFSATRQSELYQHYLAQLSLLSIRSNTSDHDGSVNYRSYQAGTLSDLVLERIVEQTELDLAWCQCGRVELPAELVYTLLSRKHGFKGLIKGTAKDPLCSFCGSSLSSSRENVKFIHLPVYNAHHVNVIPAKLGNQLSQYITDISAHPMLISRNHRVGEYDPEFHWLPFLNYLAGDTKSNITLIVSPNTFDKAIKVISFARLTNPLLDFNVVVHPLLRVKDGRISFKGLTIKPFIKVCGGVSEARGFLSIGTQWSNLESTIESRELHFVRMCVQYLPDFTPLSHSYSVEEVINVFNRNNLNHIFKQLRSYRDISDTDFRLMAQIFAKGT